MSQIIAFIQSHPTTSSLVAFYIASAFIGSLPAPAANSSTLYRFFFTFANTLGANLSRAYSSKLPVPMALAASPEAKAADVADQQSVPKVIVSQPKP